MPLKAPCAGPTISTLRKRRRSCGGRDDDGRWQGHLRDWVRLFCMLRHAVGLEQCEARSRARAAAGKFRRALGPKGNRWAPLPAPQCWPLARRNARHSQSVSPSNRAKTSHCAKSTLTGLRGRVGPAKVQLAPRLTTGAPQEAGPPVLRRAQGAFQAGVGISRPQGARPATGFSRRLQGASPARAPIRQGAERHRLEKGGGARATCSKPDPAAETGSSSGNVPDVSD